MSKSDLALSIRGVSKCYSISQNEERYDTLAETALARLRNPLARPKKETFWALKDVSFDVKKGEVVGIIGRNGAGKSTLLKILSRITEPTSGEIDLYGRVASLLEVGTGFSGELTGRENIFLNGAILGMTKGEIHRQFEAIVEFAGVGKFLDTPVKRYSSGMYVRLAFAVAAHLNPEILVVDEVLAVGDAEFQKKCLGKMEDVARLGRTVMFVSHQLDSVRRLCHRAVLLDRGSLAGIGDCKPMLERYIQTGIRSAAVFSVRPPHGEDAPAMATQLVVEDASGAPSTEIVVGRGWQIRMTIRVDRTVRNLVAGIGLVTPMNASLMTTWTPELSLDAGLHDVVFENTKIFLEPGRYGLNVGLSLGGQGPFHYVENAGAVQVSDVADELDGNLVKIKNCGTILNQFKVSVRRQSKVCKA